MQKIAFIAGDGKLLGQKLVQAFHALGWNVIGVSRHQGKSSMPQYTHITLDITSNTKGTFRDIFKEFGTPDLFINNVATYPTNDLTEITPTDIERIFATNVFAPLFIMQTLAERYAVDGLAKNAFRNRSILNVSSAAGFFYKPQVGVAERGLGAYAASKAALSVLSNVAAIEFLEKYGVRVNTLMPGSFTHSEKIVEELLAHCVQLATNRIHNTIFP